MPAVYERLGIRFEYPENWQLDEEEGQGAERAVSVFSPGGAFLSVIADAPEVDTRRLAEAALSAMQQEYEGLDFEEIEETIADFEAVGYDINFICLDLTNTAAVRAIRTDHATYLVFYQAEDREFDAIRHVFQAITMSLLRES